MTRLPPSQLSTSELIRRIALLIKLRALAETEAERASIDAEIRSLRALYETKLKL